MSTSSVCRVCFCGSVQLLSIEDSKLQEIYEKLTCSKLNTEDGRPTGMCYICISQLKKCHRFADMACQSETTLTQLIHKGIKITFNDVTALNLRRNHNLMVTDVIHMTVKEHAVNRTCRVKVEQEEVIKEEIAEIEEVEDNIDEEGVGISQTEQPLANDSDLTNNKKSYFCCNTCNRKCSSKCNLIKHLKIHTGKKPHACKKCNMAFIEPSYLKKHMRVHTGEKPYTCNECSKSFRLRNSLLSHMRTHTGEKPYACNECKKVFANRCNLKCHMVTHTEGKPYTCKECHKSFRRPITLNHMLSHTGQKKKKPYICNECKMAFSDRKQLKYHMYIHNGVKPYVCKECNMAFSQISNLKRHMRVHNGEKPYACNECDKAFSQDVSLKQHMLLHSGEKPYPCNECNVAFNRASNLKRHFRSFHA